MTGTSVGFDGTIGEPEWAATARYWGSMLPIVAGKGDWAVSVNSGATLTVNVAAGTRYAHGIRTVLASGTSLALTAAPATLGQSRWDAVILRTNWSANTVTLMSVDGVAGAGAPMVLPAGLNDNPGVTHDHVLALVQVTNGQPLPTSVQNRRYWPTKWHLANAVTELPPASAGLYGTGVKLLDGTEYRCLTDSGGSPTWVREGGNVQVFTQAAVITTGANFTAGSMTNRAVLINNNLVQLDLMVRRLSSAITAANGSGNFADTLIGTIAVNLRPDQQIDFPLLYEGGSSAVEVIGMSVIDPDGKWTLKAGTPGQDLQPSSTVGHISLHGSILFGRQGS